MYHLVYILLIAFSVTSLHTQADAQDILPQKRKVATYNYDFVRGENVVFFDDMNGYEDSVKPYRWEIKGEHDPNFLTRAFTKRIDSFQALYFKYGNGNLARPLWDTTGYTDKYRNNYWSVDFDFKFLISRDNSSNDIGVNIGNPQSGVIFGFGRWWDKAYISKSVHEEIFCMSSYEAKAPDLYRSVSVDYPTDFNRSVWHHFALAIRADSMYGYTDRCKFLAIKTQPYYYLPSLCLNGRAKVAIRNFMIARTDSAHRKKTEENISVNTLLTEKKFTTHAITFDKNKAVIRPQSMSIITQLVTFLKANPNIKLQINGHTDSDGTPTSNLTLSLNRADAIKKKLVTLGISADRLQTKGYGATQPIEPNTSPAGMAQNRRAEFVKL